MTHYARIVPALILIALAPAALSASAYAADNTRYISITGNNADPCTLTRPCRSLPKAIQVTPAGGEIRILDSGFYGNNATINKSLTITGNGNTIFLGNIIFIKTAGTVVTLRDLTLSGEGAAVQDGIRIAAAATVHIERCVIHGFPDDAISLEANAAAKVFVIDSTLRDNGAGLDVRETSVVRISNSTITGNAIGIVNTGTVETRGNNTIRGNTTTDLAGDALTPIAGL